MKKLLLTILMGLTLGSIGCSDDSNPVAAGNNNDRERRVQPITAASVYDIARTNGDFQTLTLALELTGLDEVLSADGDFTVFAPNDAAFAKLPAGTLDALTQDTDALAEILLYHVVAGRLLAADVLVADSFKTVDGRSVMVNTENGAQINSSNIIATDISGSNGVIHVIDTVLIPSERNLIERLEKEGNFTTLLAALKATELDKVVAQADGFTIFAPNDDAFAKLPAGTVQELLNDLPTLSNILLYHVVAAEVPASVAVTLTEATMANSQEVSVELADDGLFVNDSLVIQTDLNAGNGVIHVIDAVLIP